MFWIEEDTPKAPGWWPEQERGTEGSAGGTGRCRVAGASGRSSEPSQGLGCRPE